MAEHIFYNQNDVLVTKTRFVVRGKTYAMSSVSSVKTAQADRTPKTSNTLPGLGIIVATTWLVIRVAIGSKDFLGYVLPALLLLASVYWYRSFRPAQERIEYEIVLTTTAGEQSVLTSFNQDDVLPVERALIEAIVTRG